MTGCASSEKEEGDGGIRVSLEECWFICSGGCQAPVRTRRQPSPINCQLLTGKRTNLKPTFSEAKLLEDSVLTQTGWTRTNPQEADESCLVLLEASSCRRRSLCGPGSGVLLDFTGQNRCEWRLCWMRLSPPPPRSVSWFPRLLEGSLSSPDTRWRGHCVLLPGVRR